MASTGRYLFPSTADAGLVYTDSGGSTAYFTYGLIPVADQVSANPNLTTTFQQSSGLTGAAGTIVTFAQQSTSLAFVSEQFAGETYSSSGFQWNGWGKESAAAANMGWRVKFQQLSSASTFIDNIGIVAPAAEFSATGFILQSPGLTGATAFTLTSGQRIALIVQATSVAAQGGGNVVTMAWGNGLSGSTGDTYFIGNTAGYSTFVSAASTVVVIPNYQPRVISQAVNRSAYFSWNLFPKRKPELT